MKVRAKGSGFDGKNSYKAGATLTGDTEHIRRLLFNDQAEPLDKEARDFVAEKDGMTSRQRKDSRFFNSAISKIVVDVEETPKVKKRKAKAS